MRTMSTGAAMAGETDPGFTRPQQHIDALETFMREVGEQSRGDEVSVG